MTGMGRHIADGKTKFMEFLSIETDGRGKLTMWILLGAPSKGEKKRVPFRLSRIEKGAAVFENSRNEFPSKVTYRPNGEGRLHCRIEDKQGGKAEHEDFDFHEVRP